MSSWIDRALEAGEIRRVFVALLRTRDTLESHPGALPGLGPDASGTTGWTTRAPTPRAEQVRPLAEGCSAQAFETELCRCWEDQGLPELAALAPAFGALAERLRGSAPTSSSVPQLLYTMF